MTAVLGVGMASGTAAVSLAEGEEAPTPELAAPTPEMKKKAKSELDARVREQRRLAPGREERASKSQKRFKKLQRREARKLVSETFPEFVGRPWWTPPKLHDGERIVGYRGDSVALIERADGKKGLMDSKVPLRVDAPDGSKVATDLDLERVGGAFRSKAPVVETVIAADSGTIRLPDAHLGLDLPGDDVAGELIEGNKVFYANTATDTDWLVSPTPNGVAVAAHLRSVDSPHALPLDIDIPGGALLRADGQGGADIVTAQGPVAKVTPPIAVDAAEQPVDAEYRISGNQIVIEVEASEATEYPVLVDPVMDYTPWQSNPAIGRTGWRWGSSFPGFAGGEYAPWGYGLAQALGWQRWYGHAWWGWWLYSAPGGSHIYSAHFDLTHAPVSANPVCYTLGLYHSAYGWQGDSFNYGTGAWVPYINTRGPFSACSGVVHYTSQQCVNGTCSPQPGLYSNHAAFQQWTYGDGVRGGDNWSYLAGANIFLADQENPSLTTSLTPGVLSSSTQVALSFVAHDPGLGIKRVKISSPTTPGWNQYNDIQFDCYGTSWSPCPTDQRFVNVQTGNLGPGYQQIRVEVWDAGGGYTSTTPAVLRPIADGALKREDGQYAVWAFKNNRRHWVTTPDVATSAGLSLANVEVVPSGTLGLFQQGYDIVPANAMTWRLGGSNADIDTESEGDAAIAFLTDPATREARWEGLTDDDKTDLAAMDAFERWDEAAPTDASTDLGSYEGWDGEPYELDQWVPAQDQIESSSIADDASAAGFPALVPVVMTCLRWCDDALRGVGRVRQLTKGKKVVKGKRPQPRSWRRQRPDGWWVRQAGSKPSKRLEANMDAIPGGHRAAWRPHHIIPAGGRAARTAQTIARNCGIHPNEKANGVWLPKDVSTRDSFGTSRVPHSILHTRHYYQNVNRVLYQNYYAGSLDHNSRCARVRKALDYMRDALEDGSFAF